MFRKICVIGLGSLGSYLCKYLSELDQVNHLVLIDNDIVDLGNCKKSAFRVQQVGFSKTDAVAEIVSHDVNVTKIFDKYIEGETKLPRSNLVIDCRDEFCPRHKEIDIRIFISENHLVIDCMKKRECRIRIGHYIIELPRDRISTAAFFCARMIGSKEIKKLLENQIIHTIDLKTLVPLGTDDINNIIKNREDTIYDHYDESEKLLQLNENIKTIFNTNKENDIEIFIGEEHPVKEFFDLKEMPYYALIPKNSLKKSADILPVLINLIKDKEDINFIVKCNLKGSRKHVYLIQESGAA